MRKLLFVGILATLALGGASQAAEGGIVGSWRLESIGGAQDFDSAKTSLEVTPEDNISMTIGCNRMTSIPAIEGDNIDFGPVAATRMACPDPLGALEQYTRVSDRVRVIREMPTIQSFLYAEFLAVHLSVADINELIVDAALMVEDVLGKR